MTLSERDARGPEEHEWRDPREKNCLQAFLISVRATPEATSESISAAE